MALPDANPSLWPLQRGAGLLGGWLSPYSGVCQQMLGRGRTLLLFVLFSLADFAPVLSIGLSLISLAVCFMGFVPKEESLVPLLHLAACCFLSLKSMLATRGPFLKPGG